MDFSRRLTIALGSHQEGRAFQSFHIAGGDVSSPAVIPLSVLVEGVDFHSSPGVRHPGW